MKYPKAHVILKDLFSFIQLKGKGETDIQLSLGFSIIASCRGVTVIFEFREVVLLLGQTSEV